MHNTNSPLHKSFLVLLLIVFFCLLSSCAQRESNRVKTDHYVFYLYNELEESVAVDISQYLDEHHQKTLDLLMVNQVDRVDIHIWGNKEDFIAKQEEIFSFSHPNATGFVHQQSIYMIFVGDASKATALHEYVHIVSEYVNPDFRDNPRWLWESVAVYGSNFPPLNPFLMSLVTERNYPSIETFSGDIDENSMVYTFGYSLTEFIVESWGIETLNQLIKSDGDLEATLDLSDEEFSRQWFEFIAETYRN